MGRIDLEGSRLDVPANEMTDCRGVARRNSQHVASKLFDSIPLKEQQRLYSPFNAYARAGKHDTVRNDGTEVLKQVRLVLILYYCDGDGDGDGSERTHGTCVCCNTMCSIHLHPTEAATVPSHRGPPYSIMFCTSSEVKPTEDEALKCTYQRIESWVYVQFGTGHYGTLNGDLSSDLKSED
ncbi:hypothetical protein B296_00020127 [Ensete ventricosum]|uniref:Uncharacterized protein n=1 Tax=Ensete ventricosum TaxID=4639 RepID=A0A427A241_ENSVE|nr:hypothetical protein B296_00020127 [Ensete ventricosum]